MKRETKEMDSATKTNNLAMFDLLNKYDKSDQIKFFFAIINKIQAKYYGVDKTLETHCENSSDNQERVKELSETIEIPMSFISSVKSKNLTKDQIVKTMEGITKNIRCFKDNGDIDIIPPFSLIHYDKDKNVFDVIINSFAVPYLITIGSNFSWVDLKIIKMLNGKFDFGIYFIYRQYGKLNSKKYDLDSLKKLLNSKEKDSSNFKRMINKSVNKINSIEGDVISIEWETKERGKIVGIKFLFK